MSSSVKLTLSILAIALIAIGIFIFTKQDTGEINNQTKTDINKGEASNNSKNVAQDETLITTYSLSEIATHNKEGDCWLAINGKVYDVSATTATHPGGPAILEGCGTDASTLFETRPMGSGTPHSEKARDFLKTLYIGDLTK